MIGNPQDKEQGDAKRGEAADADGNGVGSIVVFSLYLMHAKVVERSYQRNQGRNEKALPNLRYAEQRADRYAKQGKNRRNRDASHELQHMGSGEELSCFRAGSNEHNMVQADFRYQLRSCDDDRDGDRHAELPWGKEMGQHNGSQEPARKSNQWCNHGERQSRGPWSEFEPKGHNAHSRASMTAAAAASGAPERSRTRSETCAPAGDLPNASPIMSLLLLDVRTDTAPD